MIDGEKISCEQCKLKFNATTNFKADNVEQLFLPDCAFVMN